MATKARRRTPPSTSPVAGQGYLPNNARVGNARTAYERYEQRAGATRRLGPVTPGEGTGIMGVVNSYVNALTSGQYGSGRESQLAQGRASFPAGRRRVR